MDTVCLKQFREISIAIHKFNPMNMKAFKLPAPVIAFLFFFSLLFSSCRDEVLRTRTYMARVPFYISVAELRSQGNIVQAPQELSVPGKIYIYGDYLFISEVNKGIHVVDNTNPANPRFISFINIAGNADMAVNSNMLYADNYVDLIVFDISNLAKISPVKRVENVFESQFIDKAKGLILGFKDSLITTVINNSYSGRNKQEFDASPNASFIGAGSYGTGGSTARFTLMSGNLYTVDNFSLRLFNVVNPREPVYVNKINIGGGIETIFPYENKLFIGSTTGMHIFDATNPSAPVKLSTYRHVTSCDPVVVQGKYAYVTLRSGNFCQQGVNVLDVLDIEDATKPKLVSSFPMLNPHGLTVTATNLFVTEGKFGLKTFDHANVLTIGQRQLAFLTDIDAADIIAGPKSLIVTGIKGIYQYNYSNPAALKLLSHLPLSNTM